MSAFSESDLCRLLGIDFSDEQLAAITAPLEPAVIMAGAGSGKTSVMTARVVWLVARGLVEPAQVLGLTFTNKAAGELRARVRNALLRLEAGTESADAATVSTYHAFAQQLLADDGLRIGLEPDLQLLSDARREQLALRVVRNPDVDIRLLSHSSRSIVGKLLSLDDRLAEEAVAVDEVRRFDLELLERMAGYEQQATGRAIMETAAERLELLALVEQFRVLKAQQQCLDYADMVRLALHLVRAREDVAARLRDTHRVVLLDEYQDTSVAQRLLMQEAFGQGHPVTAVGDALQAIYEWRGANAVNITEFPRHFARATDNGGHMEAAVYGLPRTQRFGSHIAAAANAITAELRPQMLHVQALESQSDDRFGPGQIEVAVHPDDEAEFAWIAQRLREAGATTAWRDMAVLLRQHRHAGALHRALSEAGVPAQIVGKQALLSVPDVADVVAYLRVLQDPAANVAWVRILSGLRYRLGARDLAHLGRRAAQLAQVQRPEGWEAALATAASGSDAVDLVALGEAVADPGADSGISAAGLQRLVEAQREVASLRRSLGLPVVELARTVVQRIGLDSEIEASEQSVARGRRAALEGFMELCAGFVSLDGSQSLGAFLRWLDDGEHLGRAPEIEYPLDRDAVSIMTVHAAKGLQRDLIVLPGLVEGVFPSDRGDAAWTSAADAVPFPLLHSEVDERLLDYPSPAPRSIEGKAFAALLKPRKLAEETRLAYVAVTRAQRVLIATAARRYEGKPAVPSRYLDVLRATVRERGGTEHLWSEAPVEAAAPAMRSAPWPQEMEPDHAQRLAQLVRDVRDPSWRPSSARAAADARLQAWDVAIEHHTTQRLSQREITHSVPLPASLSATELLRLARDPDAFVEALVRPMPKAPALGAKRGSAFHAWVEGRFGQQVLAFDDERDDDDLDLAPLRTAFEASPWGRRTPLAVEVPFILALGGLVVRGRMDAVYREGDDLVVVDWKTNTRGDADPLQLEAYRHAAAARFGVPLEQVRACFFFVAQGRTEWLQPQPLADLIPASVRHLMAQPVLDGTAGDGDAGGEPH